MIDHLNPYFTSTLVADRLQAARDPRHSWHAAELRAERAERRRARRLRRG
jgi:hypothetical protein